MSDSHQNGPIVDFTRLREVTGNDDQLFAELTQQYLKQADEIMAQLAIAAQDLNLEEISRLAHKLAGSSATCGMNGIVDKLRGLEHLDPNTQEQATRLFNEAQEQLQRIRETLNRSTTSD